MGSTRGRQQHAELPPWQGTMVEVAVLLFAAAAVGISANAFGPASVATGVLVCGGLVLIAGVIAYRRFDRSRTRPVLPKASSEPAVAWRIRTTLSDEPGRLAAVAARFADHEVNILALQVHPDCDAVIDEFLVEAPPSMTADQLHAVVRSGGGREAFIARADLHDLVDVPTRMLALAAQVGKGPAALVEGLGVLLGDIRAEWVPAGAEEGVESTGMVLTVPGVGCLSVARDLVPFTPSEFARARALVALDRRLTKSATRDRPAQGLRAVRTAKRVRSD